MIYECENNKYFQIDSTVVLTPTISKGGLGLDALHKSNGITGCMSSGLRNAQYQFYNVIQPEAVKMGLPDAVGARYESVVTFNGKQYPLWQILWSKVLSKGYVCNPPEGAEALLPYKHPETGQIIQPPHFVGATNHATGHAFDESIRRLSGISVEDYLKLLGKSRGLIPTIKDWLVEHGNGCIHFDCWPVA
jgi:hypothetical protein